MNLGHHWLRAKGSLFGYDGSWEGPKEFLFGNGLDGDDEWTGVIPAAALLAFAAPFLIKDAVVERFRHKVENNEPSP